MTKFLLKKLIIIVFYSFVWLTVPALVFILLDQEATFLKVVGMIFFVLISLGILFLFSHVEIKNVKENYTVYIQKNILLRMNYDLTDLIVKPKHLINRLISRYNTNKIYKCMHCRRKIGFTEFHYSSLATNNPTKTCIDCMRKSKNKFNDELTYIKIFEGRFREFLRSFKEINSTYFPEILISTESIEEYFYKSVKQLRKQKLIE